MSVDANLKRSGRQTNIEALRVVSMLMIITMHFLGHGGVMKTFNEVSSIQLICELISGICRVAVNCFILISGYFLVDSRFKWSKVLKLWIEIWFYSVVIFLILLASGRVEFGFKNLAYVLFPVSTNSDAFSTEYLVMYILSPFINCMIQNLEKKQFQSLLALLAGIFVVVPGVFCFITDTMPYGGPYGIGWFLILYLTGAYIKRIGVSISKGKSILLYILTGLLVPLSCICACILFKATNRDIFWNFKELFYSYNSILVYPASVSLFIMMLKVEITNSTFNRIISFLAPTTFGVYLIHDNRFMRDVLWSVLDPGQYSGTWFLLAYWIFALLSIFLICAIIDKMRERVFSAIHKS